MIRFPRSSLSDMVRRETASLNARIAEVQSQAISGLALQRPSDDPVGIVAAQRLSATVADQDVWIANADRAISVHDVADTALAGVNDALVRARELAVAMASETVDADARATAALEAQGLFESVLAAANTRFDGRYVFAGAAWDAPPFATDGTYTGDTSSPTARVGEDRWVETGFDGSAVFAGSVDVLTTLSGLVTALQTNDVAGVSASLDDLDLATDQIAGARGEVGVQTQNAEDARSVAESMGVVMSERLTALTQADPVETYTLLNDLQSAYTSTLQVAASASTKSLLDYLG
jgi:flagellar hook-associated protein 3 FlgL